jgi:hypothetical protein
VSIPSGGLLVEMLFSQIVCGPGPREFRNGSTPLIFRMQADFTGLITEQTAAPVGGRASTLTCDQGSAEPRRSADTEGVARAEAVGDPTDDRSANRGVPPQGHASPQGHNRAPHRWICRELHDVFVPLVNVRAATVLPSGPCSALPLGAVLPQ